MEVSVAAQAWGLAGAVALGLGAGILYDLFRLLRHRTGSRMLEWGADLLFWAAVTGALFLYAQTAEGGEVRLYLSLGLLTGGILYFCCFSRAVLSVLGRMLDIFGKILHIFTAPARWVGNILLKIQKKMKNHFLSWARWYRIHVIQGE